LIAGAILFQAASVLDGVDGEIARATFRTSASGATLDSLTDALTNMGFLIGLGINLHLQGFGHALVLGLAGFGFLGIGLAVLGLHTLRTGKSVNFDALKQVVRRYQSPLADWVVWLTMRDFLALASAVMVVLGLASTLLVVFAGGTFLWLLAVLSFAAVEAATNRRGR
jgi:CDP-L-myo-inositol myo-inositolphosphotransferase